jgi:hypothetical protein
MIDYQYFMHCNYQTYFNFIPYSNNHFLFDFEVNLIDSNQ